MKIETSVFQICVREFLPSMDGAWTKQNINKHDSKLRLVVHIISLVLNVDRELTPGKDANKASQYSQT